MGMKAFFNLSKATTLIGNGPLSTLVPIALSYNDDLDQPSDSCLECELEGGAMLPNCDTDEGRQQLGSLIDDVALYRISLELMLDRLLDEAERDRKARSALKNMGAGTVPAAIDNPLARQYGFEGILNHPGLASRSTQDLFGLFLILARTMPEHARPIELFLPHSVALTDKMDGFIQGNTGWVRFDKVIYGAARIGQDRSAGLENYAERGRQAAMSMAIEDHWGLLAAWIQAESAQTLICRDIDAVLSLKSLQKAPRWISIDIFSLLEREAMKQVFAERMAETPGEMPPVASKLAEAIKLNAKGGVNAHIQKLMNQTISSNARYSGAAADFVAQAELNRAQALKILAD